MNEVLYELSEMTDSREIMESKEPKAMRMFILILFFIVITAAVGGCFFKVEEYTSLTGEVCYSEANELSTYFGDANTEKLEIMIYVPESEFSRICIGQKAEYAFTALSYSKYGKASGEIVYLSATPAIEEATGARYYVAKASINDNTLSDDDGNLMMITNGMTVKVSIINKTESAMSWLIKKIV